MDKKIKWIVFGFLAFIVIYILGKNSDTGNPITDTIDNATNDIKDAIASMTPHTEYDNQIKQSSAKYGVPESWIKAVIYTESGFNPKAYRAEPRINDGSYGLMQLLYRTAQSLGFQGQPDDLYDPSSNIDLGTKFILDCHRSSGAGTWDDMAFQIMYSAYNSGSGARFMTSSQVDANVRRAYNWLIKVEDGTA